MTDDRIEGEAKHGLGRVQDAVGGLIGSDPTQIKGKINEAAGSVQDAVGKAKQQAEDAYSQARDKAGDLVGELESFLRDKPLAALGIGVLIGMALRGGRKTVYIRK